MGYTHYWRRIEPAYGPAWDEYILDVSAIVKHCTGEGIPLGNGGGDEGSYPLVGMASIIFNGIGDEAHETFLMARVPNDRGFAFCKTAHKPYDIAVCLALIMAKKRLGTDIEIASDGSADEWQEAFT